MCALHMSGAAEETGQLMDDAYGLEFAHIYLASADFRNALSALLLLGSCTGVYKYGLALNQLN